MVGATVSTLQACLLYAVYRVRHLTIATMANTKYSTKDRHSHPSLPYTPPNPPNSKPFLLIKHPHSQLQAQATIYLTSSTNHPLETENRDTPSTSLPTPPPNQAQHPASTPNIRPSFTPSSPRLPTQPPRIVLPSKPRALNPNAHPSLTHPLPITPDSHPQALIIPAHPKGNPHNRHRNLMRGGDVMSP